MLSTENRSRPPDRSSDSSGFGNEETVEKHRYSDVRNRRSPHTFRTWIKRINQQSRQETLSQWISIEGEDFRPCPQTPGGDPQESSRQPQPHRNAEPAEIWILYEKVTICLPTELSPDYLARILLTLGQL